MLKITNEQFGRIVPHPGNVFIQMPFFYKEEKNGFALANLLSDDSYSERLNRTGVIRKISPVAVDPEQNAGHEGEICVKIGDKVWVQRWDLLRIIRAAEMEMNVFQCGDYYLVQVPYTCLVMKLEGGEYRGLNDCVIAEAIKEDTGFINVAKETEQRLFKVVAAPDNGATDPDYSAWGDGRISVPVKKGDVVFIEIDGKDYVEDLVYGDLPAPYVSFQSCYIRYFTHERV